MKKSIITILLLTAASLAFAEGKAQTTCPVMGGTIDKAQYADVDGVRVYVCCPGCVAKVKADPKTYIAKLKAEGVELEKAPKGEMSKKEMHSGHSH